MSKVLPEAPTSQPAALTAVVVLTPELELRVAPVAAEHQPAFTHLDLRLYRRMPAPHGAGYQTCGGFRVPFRLVGELVGTILAVAKAVERQQDARDAG